MRRYRPLAPVAAVSALVLREDAVLLVRRAAPPNKGRWSLPGGTVKLGETVRDAVVREVREETGLAVEVGDVVDVADVLVPPQARPRYHFVLVVFRARVIEGTIRPGSDARDARWIPIPELARFDVTETTLQVLARARPPARRGEPGPSYM